MSTRQFKLFAQSVIKNNHWMTFLIYNMTLNDMLYQDMTLNDMYLIKIWHWMMVPYQDMAVNDIPYQDMTVNDIHYQCGPRTGETTPDCWSSESPTVSAPTDDTYHSLPDLAPPHHPHPLRHFVSLLFLPSKSKIIQDSYKKLFYL